MRAGQVAIISIEYDFFLPILSPWYCGIMAILINAISIGFTTRMYPGKMLLKMTIQGDVIIENYNSLKNIPVE